eukprot:14556511-Alexandrium_andersonii.AAC.1
MCDGEAVADATMAIIDQTDALLGIAGGETHASMDVDMADTGSDSQAADPNVADDEAIDDLLGLVPRSEASDGKPAYEPARTPEP